MAYSQRGRAGADGFDAIVVGAGPNGLVAALTLAEAGWRVLVREAADVPGGGLRTEDLTLPGFRHDVCATVLPLALASPALRGFDPGPGPLWAHPPLPLAHPLDDGPAALLHRDVAETARLLGDPRPLDDPRRLRDPRPSDDPCPPEGAEVAVAPDTSGWSRLFGPLAATGTRLADSVLAPFDLPPRAPLTLAALAALGVWPAAAFGRAALRGERARALFAGLAAHSLLDLRHPASAGYGLFLGALGHQVGWPVAVGGSASLARRLVARIEALGGEIATAAPVRRLAELPPARAVLLDLTPRQVLAVAGDDLPPRYRAALARYRYGPAAFKVDWALDGPVPWRDAAVRGAGTVHLGGTLAEVTAAEAQVARGRHPERPFVLFVQACVADPGRAPAGRHTGYAYCHVPSGSTVDMTAAIEAQVERFAPGFRDTILARHVLGPAALEAHNANLVGGDIGGGIADIRQLVARPVRSPRPWATPLPGVYLCSAATQPGAGVHGMGGAQAARLALRRADLRRR